MKSNIKELVESINNNKPDHKINIMEVCGTHTMAISRYGLRQLIPETINLISGPGCPVCVTPAGDIDWIIRDYENSMKFPYLLLGIYSGYREVSPASIIKGQKVKI